jgi:hypothetical protein
MSEFRVHRIVVACDPICELDSAIETASRLAVRWNARLQGVFLEDASLRQAAALPFVRQVTLTGRMAESFEPSDIEQQFRLMAREIERKLSSAALRLGLEWSFSVEQALFEQDNEDSPGALIVMESHARAFAGQFRLPSAWAKLPYRVKLPVLLLRGNPNAGHPVVLLLDPAARAAARSLTAAVEMAVLGQRQLIVLAKAPAAEAEIRKAVAEISPAVAARCRVESCKDVAEVSEHRLAALDTGLLVIDATAGDGAAAALEDLAQRTAADVLLIR